MSYEGHHFDICYGDILIRPCEVSDENDVCDFDRCNIIMPLKTALEAYGHIEVLYKACQRSKSIPMIHCTPIDYDVE
jgi:hypothetical protein